MAALCHLRDSLGFESRKKRIMADAIGIKITPISQLSVELNKELDEIDRLAFADDMNIPEFEEIEWSSPDWMVFGRLGEKVVSQLILLIREIKVGERLVKVVGVGGVADRRN